MMVKYAEDAPPDYEPEYFKTCGSTALQMCEAGTGNKKLRVKVRRLRPAAMELTLVTRAHSHP